MLGRFCSFLSCSWVVLLYDSVVKMFFWFFCIVEFVVRSFMIVGRFLGVEVGIICILNIGSNNYGIKFRR